MKTFSYLALGDSYTIGEQVALTSSFPYQTVSMLRSKGIYFNAPEIIAQTGWTTHELEAAITEAVLLPAYNMVSLLIGVNNQYRQSSVEEFRLHFRFLLEKSISLAGGSPQNVVVFSIPDWGVTPFADGKDKDKIRSEIDLYNFICQAEAESFQTHFIDITATQRKDGSLEDFLAADKLHPSAKEYFKWAEILSDKIIAFAEGKSSGQKSE